MLIPSQYGRDNHSFILLTTNGLKFVDNTTFWCDAICIAALMPFFNIFFMFNIYLC